MKVIGLTGGIGSGKSTVASLLAGLGAVVIDLDKVGHEAIKPGSESRERIIKEFGKDILTASGEIDRTRLGRLVFNNHEKLKGLNRIIHPVIDDIVEARLEEYRRDGVGVVVLEAAAMLEAERAWQADELWVTVAPEAVVLRRLAIRTEYSEEELKARIRAQLSNEERMKHADVVIDTDCSLNELKERVVVEWRKLLTRL
jgi:dephospho-CoA kinase